MQHFCRIFTKNTIKFLWMLQKQNLKVLAKKRGFCKESLLLPKINIFIKRIFYYIFFFKYGIKYFTKHRKFLPHFVISVSFRKEIINKHFFISKILTFTKLLIWNEFFYKVNFAFFAKNVTGLSNAFFENFTNYLNVKNLHRICYNIIFEKSNIFIENFIFS